MYTGKIVAIAFPDTYVRYSENFVQEKIFPILGLGKKGYIKAGHALLLLIENKTGNIHYYDFGRYITPPKHGRVRSALTDVELEIPIKAKTDQDKIVNIKEILSWLTLYPEKTHGSGRLIASVCNEIDFNKAESFLKSIQSKGSIPYRAFGNEGSNCSRLVTDTIINASDCKKVVKPLKRNNKFTPSPLGNVKYAANGGSVYLAKEGTCVEYKKSLQLEIVFNYFDRNIPKITTTANLNNEKIEVKQNLHYLGGIGASAFFEIAQLDKNYLIKRYDENLNLNFGGIFRVDKEGFNFNEKYQFIYDSNCLYCHIKQHNVIYRFNLIEKIN